MAKYWGKFTKSVMKIRFRAKCRATDLEYLKSFADRRLLKRFPKVNKYFLASLNKHYRRRIPCFVERILDEDPDQLPLEYDELPSPASESNSW